jgi:antitoxin HicB
MDYRIILTPDDNGTFLVTFPDVPEATSFGETEEEARAHAVDALETALAARMGDQAEIPAPVRPKRGEDFVTLPTLSALKIALYREMRAQGVRQAELARRIGVHPPQVGRLLDLRHASRHDQIDGAFAALGKRVDVSVRSAA